MPVKRGDVAMPIHKKPVTARPTLSSGRGRAPDIISAKEARVAVNEYCLLKYASNFSSGIPARLSLSSPKAELWIVPVVLTSPGYGWVGEVGMVAVDACTGDVIGAEPRQKVFASARRLEEENRNALETAFLRAKSAGNA